MNRFTSNPMPGRYGAAGAVRAAASLLGKEIAWFSSDPLRSGWGWGQQYLNATVGAVEAKVGKGKVCLFGPEITFRGQPHGTFKFLFNAIQLAGATTVNLE